MRGTLYYNVSIYNYTNLVTESHTEESCEQVLVSYVYLYLKTNYCLHGSSAWHSVALVYLKRSLH